MSDAVMSWLLPLSVAKISFHLIVNQYWPQPEIPGLDSSVYNEMDLKSTSLAEHLVNGRPTAHGSRR